MANGNNHDRLAQKVEDIERRIEERGVRREAEATRTWELIADLAARLDAAEKAVARVEGIRQPGALQLWGPAVATLVLVGSAGAFVLNERVNPVREIAITASRDTRDLSGLYGQLARDHAAAAKEIEWHRDWVSSLQTAYTRLDEKLDNLRVLVERKEK